MRVLILFIVSFLVANSIEIVGIGLGVDEQSKKEALSDLSSQLVANVKSSYQKISTIQGSKYGVKKTNLIRVESNLPLKSVKLRFEDANNQTLAILNSHIALKVYIQDLKYLKKEIISLENKIKTEKDKTKLYNLYISLLELVDKFYKNKVVATILGGKDLEDINITKSIIKDKIIQLSNNIEDIKLGAKILTKNINKQYTYYVYPVKIVGSNEITQFARVLKDNISHFIKTTTKPIYAKYFIRGKYEILKNSIFVTIKVMDINNKVLLSNSLIFDKKAYKQLSYKPKTINFDEAINKSFVKDEFKIKLGIKGYYKSEGIDLTESDSINLIIKSNKPACYYIIGYVLKDKDKYSYLLQLKDDDTKEAFIDRITGEDVNRYVSLGEMDVVKPLGRESLHLVAQTLIDGKCDIKIPDCKWVGDLCIISKNPAKTVYNTRALKFHKSNKTKKADYFIDFTSFKK